LFGAEEELIPIYSVELSREAKRIRYCFTHAADGLLQIPSSLTNAHIPVKPFLLHISGLVWRHPYVWNSVSRQFNGSLNPMFFMRILFIQHALIQNYGRVFLCKSPIEKKFREDPWFKDVKVIPAVRRAAYASSGATPGVERS
jgi:hypothetical protein